MEKDECVECLDETTNWVIVLAQLLVISIVIMILVKSSLNADNRPKAYHSIYLRNLVNYINVIILMSLYRSRVRKAGIIISNSECI